MAGVVLFPLNANDPNVDPSLIDPPSLLAESSKAREIILELEHELNDAKCVIADQAIALTKNSSRRRGAKLLLAAIAAFLIGWVIDPPAPIHRLIYGDKAIATELSYRFPHACTFTCSIPPKTDARDI